MFRVTGSVLCCWLVCVSGAQGAQPLPSPLTLDDAIALAERSLPAIELVQAQRTPTRPRWPRRSR